MDSADASTNWLSPQKFTAVQDILDQNKCAGSCQLSRLTSSAMNSCDIAAVTQDTHQRDQQQPRVPNT